MASPDSFGGGGLEVLIGADTSEFEAAMQRIAAQARAAGKAMESAGRRLTEGLTVPLAAAGTAAVASTAKMESALAQAQAQAGLTDDAMRQISESAERIATQTGQSFSKIVDSYKFAQSAGLDLAESQEIVETAAKAAAAGFGQQTTLLRGMTTVMEGFGEKAGSSSEIMDKLVATAQNLEVEVPALTNVMGRLVNVSSEVGISFDEMLAAVGTVGERFGDVQRAGTLMATSLGQLIDPSDQVREQMQKIGTSASQLKRSIEQDGIAQAMSDLRQRAEGAGVEFASLLQGQRATQVMLALTADEGQRVSEVMQGAADSTGRLQQAFEQSESFMRLLSRAFQSAQIALRPLGSALIDVLAPALAAATSKIRQLSERFASMSKEGKATALAIGGIAAAAGPVLVVLGKLITVLSTLAFSTLPAVGSAAAAAWAAVTTPIGLAIAGITAIAGAATLVVTKWEGVKSFFGGFFTALGDLGRSTANVIGSFFTFVAQKIVGFFENILNRVGTVAADLAGGLGFEELAGKIRDGTGAIIEFGRSAEETKKQGEQAMEDMSQAASDLGSSVVQMGEDTLGAVTGMVKGARDKIAGFLSGGAGGGGGGRSGGAGGRGLGLGAAAGGIAMAEEAIEDAQQSSGPAISRDSAQFAMGMARKATQKMTRMQRVGKQAGNALQSSFMQMGRGIGNAVSGLVMGEKSFKSFAQVGKRMIGQLISKLAALVAKMAVIGPLLGALGLSTGGAGFALAGGGGSLLGLASGGIVTGPTLAMIGEGSDDEAVMPLSKLDQMMGGQAGGTVQGKGGRLAQGRIEIPVEVVDKAQGRGSQNRTRTGRG